MFGNFNMWWYFTILNCTHPCKWSTLCLNLRPPHQMGPCSCSIFTLWKSFCTYHDPWPSTHGMVRWAPGSPTPVVAEILNLSTASHGMSLVMMASIEISTCPGMGKGDVTFSLLTVITAVPVLSVLQKTSRGKSSNGLEPRRSRSLRWYICQHCERSSWSDKHSKATSNMWRCLANVYMAVTERERKKDRTEWHFFFFEPSQRMWKKIQLAAMEKIV